jgi:hypothetical protein
MRRPADERLVRANVAILYGVTADRKVPEIPSPAQEELAVEMRCRGGKTPIFLVGAPRISRADSMVGRGRLMLRLFAVGDRAWHRRKAKGRLLKFFEVLRAKMIDRYWLVHPNGGKQWIDPMQFDLVELARRATGFGGNLVVEKAERAEAVAKKTVKERAPFRFEPPVGALSALFLHRLARVYPCRETFDVDMNTRPTRNRLGSYYRVRRLIRVYTHETGVGRRPLEDLFDTFLHEVAHHLEYSEPDSYHATECGRVPGRMHSRLFWIILGDLKARWSEVQLNGKPSE